MSKLSLAVRKWSSGKRLGRLAAAGVIISCLHVYAHASCQDQDAANDKVTAPEVLAAAADYVDPVTGLGFVLVKGGTFVMGEPDGEGFGYQMPPHQVTLSDFYISQTEVTQRQWMKVTNYNPSHFRGYDLPVDQVSWSDIQEVLVKLNRQTGQHYRLPTEAEWEYAARSGGKAERWSGTDKIEELGDYVWYKVNSDQRSHPVATKKPNGLGIYDMSGSLWEWVADRFNEAPSDIGPQVNPKGPEVSLRDDFRGYKGGAWDYIPQIVRAASRSGNEPTYKRRWIGFRIAIDAPLPAK